MKEEEDGMVVSQEESTKLINSLKDRAIKSKVKHYRPDASHTYENSFIANTTLEPVNAIETMVENNTSLILSQGPSMLKKSTSCETTETKETTKTKGTTNIKDTTKIKDTTETKDTNSLIKPI